VLSFGGRRGEIVQTNESEVNHDERVSAERPEQIEGGCRVRVIMITQDTLPFSTVWHNCSRSNRAAECPTLRAEDKAGGLPLHL
jgi:hypothetical protein